MGKIYGMLVLLALFGAFFASSAEEIATGKALVDAKADCGKLGQDQLESIGEYIMELRHSGQAHEYMDNMMGGEGSASLKNAHILMAQVMYCGRTDVPLTYGGMMGMDMIGGYGAGAAGSYGMMGAGARSGMMGFASGSPGYGMMGYGYPSHGWGITDILVVILFIGLILLVYAHALGKLREGKEKRK